MKILLPLTLLLCHQAFAFDVSFVAAKKWQGDLSTTQVCQRFNANGKSAASPAFFLHHIPKRTTHVRFSYNDDNYPPMAHGGHGVYDFVAISRLDRLWVPSILGETSLPKGFKAVQMHLSQDWSHTSGVYLPPCSGGQHHQYSVDITALDRHDKVLGHRQLILGNY